MANTMLGHTETMDYFENRKSDEAYQKGYREGFQDGYTAAQRNMLGLQLNARPEWIVTCPVCHIDWSKPMGYVCSRHDCPRTGYAPGNTHVMLTE